MVEIRGKVDDKFQVVDMSTGRSYDGYVPANLGLGSGDYIKFQLCLQCMTIQRPLLSPGEVEQLLEDLFTQIESDLK
jgi:hypothetical protein